MIQVEGWSDRERSELWHSLESAIGEWLDDQGQDATLPIISDHTAGQMADAALAVLAGIKDAQIEALSSGVLEPA